MLKVFRVGHYGLRVASQGGHAGVKNRTSQLVTRNLQLVTCNHSQLATKMPAHFLVRRLRGKGRDRFEPASLSRLQWPWRQSDAAFSLL
jgi:hypothetical protein